VMSPMTNIIDKDLELVRVMAFGCLHILMWLSRLGGRTLIVPEARHRGYSPDKSNIPQSLSASSKLSTK
jgi:hypothetical protein